MPRSRGSNSRGAGGGGEPNQRPLAAQGPGVAGGGTPQAGDPYFGQAIAMSCSEAPLFSGIESKL